MPALLQTGQQLGGYEILGVLGRGGMGEVYRAQQLSMQRQVALKVLAPHLARKDPVFAKRFVDEAHAAGRLNHPHIIAVHDVGHALLPGGSEQVHFFSMELVEGETAKQRLQREGALALDVLAHIATAMAEALVFAEAHAMVHRDIKPDNIMLGTNGAVKLADLGLATQAGGEDTAGARDEQGRIKVMGTPLYMSPEQARGQTLDGRSDQYSFGATLFHLLTGQPPYRGSDAGAIMRAHLSGPIPDPRDLRPDAPPGWSQLCLRLMAKAPDERFANAVELRVAIAHVVAGKSVPPRRAAPAAAPGTAAAAPARSPLRFVLAAAVMVLLAGGATTFALTRGTRQPVTSTANPEQAALARARDAIAALPADHAAALDQLAVLARDPGLAPAAAVLTAERDRRTGLLALVPIDAELSGIAGDLDAERIDSAAQRISKLASALAAAQRRTELDALAARLDTVRASAATGLSARAAAATEAAALDALSQDPRVRSLAAAQQRAVEDAITARRAALLAESAGRWSPGWIALAATLDERRCAEHYPKIASEVGEALALLPVDERALAQPLTELGTLAWKTEAALRALIKSAHPQVEVAIAGRTAPGKTEAVILDELTFKGVTWRPAHAALSTTSATVTPRTTITVPWALLIDQALAAERIQPAAAHRLAFLWLWRAPEATALVAGAASSAEPLVDALRELEHRGRPQRLAGTLSLISGELTVDYAFANLANPGVHLLGDFSAPFACALGSGGMAVPFAKPRSGGNEVDLIAARWNGSLRPPFAASASVACAADSIIGFGLHAGAGVVRLLVNLRLPVGNQVGIVITKPDGTFLVIEVPGAPAIRADVPVAITLSIAADGIVDLAIAGWNPFTAGNRPRPKLGPAPTTISLAGFQRSGSSSATIAALTVRGRKP